jgi:hypothetical protein
MICYLNNIIKLTAIYFDYFNMILFYAVTVYDWSGEEQETSNGRTSRPGLELWDWEARLPRWDL